MPSAAPTADARADARAARAHPTRAADRLDRAERDADRDGRAMIAIASGIEVVGESAAFSPDGTWFAFTARPADRVRRLRTSTPGASVTERAVRVTDDGVVVLRLVVGQRADREPTRRRRPRRSRRR